MKKLFFYVSFLLLLVSIAGCATRIPIQHMVPAEDNMSEYRDLAILSVEPFQFNFLENPSSIVPDLSGTFPVRVYPGYQPFSERILAEHATGTLVEALEDTGYFNLLPPSEADLFGSRIHGLQTLGSDAALRVKFDRLDIEEYVYARKVEVDVQDSDSTETEELAYCLRQKISVSLSYEIVDTLDGQQVYARTFRERQEKTFTLDPDEGAVLFAPSLTPALLDMIDRMVLDMTESLAPRWVRSNIALMKNRPEVGGIETAYTAAEEGQMAAAFKTFHEEWQVSRHVPSGYNAALLAEALGRREEAIELMDAVFSMSGNGKAERQLDRMRRYQADHALAVSQF